MTNSKLRIENEQLKAEIENLKKSNIALADIVKKLRDIQAIGTICEGCKDIFPLNTLKKVVKDSNTMTQFCDECYAERNVSNNDRVQA